MKLNISALTDVTFEDNKTFLFIDEVQECKDIVTKLKFWVDDGRIKLVLSGSLLGVELKDLKSAMAICYSKAVEALTEKED